MASDAPLAVEAASAAFVDSLVAHGVAHVCITPGSRSTPLTIAFAMQPAIRPWLHLDERASAFFALGLAKATGRPARSRLHVGDGSGQHYPGRHRGASFRSAPDSSARQTGRRGCAMWARNRRCRRQGCSASRRGSRRTCRRPTALPSSRDFSRPSRCGPCGVARSLPRAGAPELPVRRAAHRGGGPPTASSAGHPPDRRGDTGPAGRRHRSCPGGAQGLAAPADRRGAGSTRRGSGSDRRARRRIRRAAAGRPAQRPPGGGP